MSFNWVDITSDFTLAVQELKLGELLHDEMFGLFEAMSAIEMMDPKMDAGMMCNRVCPKALNFEEAVSAGTLQIEGLTSEQKIGIIDDTLSCLVTWLEGHSLAQTVFTNVFLHNPLDVVDSCIKSFSVVTLKIVDIVREIINKASVFEEEDFQSLVYGYRLCQDISDSKACGMLREVEEELNKKIRLLQKIVSNESDGITNGCEKESEDEKDGQAKLLQHSCALAARLKFFRSFLTALIGLKKEVFSKSTSVRSDAARRRPDGECRQLEEVDKQLLQCADTFSTWRETLPLGVKPQEKQRIGGPELRPDYPTIMGFEPLINQRLLPPTFPRYTKMKTRKEAVSYMMALVNRLRHVIRVYECAHFHDALDYFINFSKSSSPSSCVFSRSILQTLYLQQKFAVLGETPLTDCLRDAVYQFIRPPSLQPKTQLFASQAQSKELLELFFAHCCQPMSSLLQINGHNRARQREKLAQILDELANLQSEAEKLDTFLNRHSQRLDPPFSHMGFYSTWILYHILRVMIQYLLSGFELELYATHEFPYIYWYLYEFLFGWLFSTLNRAINLQDNSEQNNVKKKSKQKKRPKTSSLFREARLSRALQELCGGLYRAVSAFKLEKKLREPWSCMNSEKIRYEHRFAPFNNVLAPPAVVYVQYVESEELLSTTRTSAELYGMACTCFAQARSLLEEISDPNEEVQSYLKVAKTNMVVLKLLLTGQMNNSKSHPEFDFSANKNFPIIRIL